MKQRKAFGQNANTFYKSLEKPVALPARELREIIRKAAPKAIESIKWGMPVYEAEKLICAVRVSNDYVALQFYTSGTSLKDPGGILEGTGKKMRHVKVRSKADIRKGLFTSWIRQSIKGA